MNDEDFHQIVLDYINMIEPQRHRDIMAAHADVKAGQEAILAAVAELTKESRDALGVLKDRGASGHAAVLDDVVAGNEKILEAVKNASGELKSSTATTPMPGQTPGPQ
jgi:hypothetical protein